MIKLFLGNADLNKDLVLYFPTSGFGYYGTCVYGICSEKDDGIWEQPDLGSCPPGNLGLLLFLARLCSKVFISQKNFVDLIGSLPFLPQSLFPSHERTSLFSLRPHASFQMVYSLLPSSCGSFYRQLWKHSCSRFPTLATLISISSKDSQARLI